MTDNSSLPVLSISETQRYGRQLLLPSFGTLAQQRLLASRVLVIGMGGLGSTVVPLLAATGVGCLGLVDEDVVEISNLHRQVMHTEAGAATGISKVASACDTVRQLNSAVKCECHEERLNASNAVRLVQAYDVVVDCTDNLAARYLINDACVIACKPLISGAAQGFEGQLSIYWAPSEATAIQMGGRFSADSLGCYRCAFPVPPGTAHRGSCNDNGVLGPVPATIGSLQATEVIKVCVVDGIVHKGSQSSELCPLLGHLLVYNARDFRNGGIRTIKFRRNRRKNCAACGPNRTICTMVNSLAFCTKYGLPVGATCPATPIPPPGGPTTARLTCNEVRDRIDRKCSDGLLLLDVRPEVQFNICRLPTSVNVPLRDFKSRESDLRSLAGVKQGQHRTVVCICRRGNDSQRAAWALAALEGFDSTLVVDMVGGLEEWSKKIDPEFPMY